MKNRIIIVVLLTASVNMLFGQSKIKNIKNLLPEKNEYRIKKIITYYGSKTPYMVEEFAYNDNNLLKTDYKQIDKNRNGKKTYIYKKEFEYNEDGFWMIISHNTSDKKANSDTYFFKKGKVVKKVEKREKYSKVEYLKKYIYKRKRLISYVNSNQERLANRRKKITPLKSIQYVYNGKNEISSTDILTNRKMKDFYFSDNKLDSVYSYIYSGGKKNCVIVQNYTYDNGKLVSLVEYIVRGSRKMFSEECKFEYNANGLLSKRTTIDDTGAYLEILEYELGNGNANFIFENPEKKLLLLPQVI